jgi:hypothetical protein
MTRYLTLYEGDEPSTAQPLIATSDPEIVREVQRLLIERLDGPPLEKIFRLPTRHARPRTAPKDHDDASQ